LPSHREHVTPFINQQPDRYKIGSYKGLPDFSRFRWTVDELADFELVERIYSALYPRNPTFTTRDTLRFLTANP
jgi:spore coat polysaccharide biosynthesis protein SpsF (cytidylyltransferase family)